MPCAPGAACSPVLWARLAELLVGLAHCPGHVTQQATLLAGPACSLTQPVHVQTPFAKGAAPQLAEVADDEDDNDDDDDGDDKDGDDAGDIASNGASASLAAGASGRTLARQETMFYDAGLQRLVLGATVHGGPGAAQQWLLQRAAAPSLVQFKPTLRHA